MALDSEITINGKKFGFNLASGTDISMVLKPNQPNVNCYYAQNPESEIIRAGDFVGSVAEGGPVNYNLLRLIPHGNGTHTECYGHIAPNPEATLSNCLKKFHFIGRLVSITEIAIEGQDTYITASQLEYKLKRNTLPVEALIIRTLPNRTEKLNAQYSGTNPTYFEPACGKMLAEAGITQLILDLPSFDREEDEGLLAAHKGFWQYPANIRTDACITELVYIPDSVPDGYYMVNIQTINIHSDASPSRVVLYPLNELPG